MIDNSHTGIPHRAYIIDVTVSENIILKPVFKDETKHSIIRHKMELLRLLYDLGCQAVGLGKFTHHSLSCGNTGLY